MQVAFFCVRASSYYLPLAALLFYTSPVMHHNILIL